ncbi:MAG: alpha/beta fold hydrolase [Chitinophagales bacterium]
MNFFIPVKSSSIHAIRFGSGEQLLLCFHGFGESAEKFRALHPALSELFTVVAIDLPFHGDTKWQQGDFFLQEDLEYLITSILHREHHLRFSLMGYSLGGKIVLATIPHFVSQIDAVILAAPDGVKVNAWYNIAVYPEWGRKLFNRFVTHPQIVFTIARGLKFTGLLSERFFKFLQVQTNTEEKRQKVYDVWITIKDFEVELEEVKSLLNEYKIKSYIFIGKYDMVITQKIGKQFARGLHQCQYIVLDKGHNLITESFNEPLKQALTK